MTRKVLALLLVSVLAAAALGCGKKGWPEPDIGAEQFQWVEASGTMRKTCLVVRGELTGNIENLDAVFLELDEGECPGCPFRPDRRLGFDLPSPYVTREGNIFTANFCGLDGDAVYRWRLVGRNVFDIHEEAKSEVQTTAPTP